MSERERVATVALFQMPLEGSWVLEIEVVGHEDYGVEREGPTPGALLDYAVKWATDRGLKLGIAGIGLYR